MPVRLVSTMPRLALRFLLPSALAIFMAPFLVLLFYSVPATDDFCKASLAFDAVPQPSALAITALYYMKWTPRSLTTFLEALIMSHVNLAAAYGWLLLMVMAVNVGALWYYFLTIFRLPRAKALLVAVLFYSAWVASIRQPVETIYWLTGALEYNLSLSALLVLGCLFYRPSRTAWHSAGAMLLSFAIPAMHEIAGTFLCGVLLAGAVVSRIRRLPTRHWYLSLGLGGLSLGIMMVAPGVALRAASEHRHLWDIAHSPKWVAQAVYQGMHWASYPAMLVAVCCIVLVSRDGVARDAWSPLPKWFGE
jgi:hypothetical protein